MNTYQKLGSVIALVLGSSALANADVLYNNLGTGTTTGEINFFLPPGYIANEFSTLTLCPSGCTLGNITLSLVDVTGGTSTTGYQLGIFADNAGAPVGSSLISFNNPPGGFTGSADNNLFTPIGTYSLGSNTKYWVELTANNPADSISWDYNGGGLQAVAGQLNNGVWNMTTCCSGTVPNLMMKVEATPNAVPVPGAIWMMGSALLGLVSSWRQKARI